MSFEYQANL